MPLHRPSVNTKHKDISLNGPSVTFTQAFNLSQHTFLVMMVILGTVASANANSSFAPCLMMPPYSWAVPVNHTDLWCIYFFFWFNNNKKKKTWNLCQHEGQTRANNAENTWQKSRHIHKCDNWNVEGITKADEASPFHWWVDIQAAWGLNAEQKSEKQKQAIAGEKMRPHLHQHQAVATIKHNNSIYSGLKSLIHLGD